MRTRRTRRTKGWAGRGAGTTPLLLAALLGAPALAAQDAEGPEARFRALEERLLQAEQASLDFAVAAEGAAEIQVEGSLHRGADGSVEMRARGTFGGQPVDLLLRTDGESYEFGNGPGRARPPQLWEALVVGFMRMGILHNLARLTGNAAPDHADGGAAEWVVVDGFRNEDGAVGFDITVSGQPSGSAALEMDAEGLPVVRRQTVAFPTGEMRVVERYGQVVVEP